MIFECALCIIYTFYVEARHLNVSDDDLLTRGDDWGAVASRTPGV